MSDSEVAKPPCKWSNEHSDSVDAAKGKRTNGTIWGFSLFFFLSLTLCLLFRKHRGSEVSRRAYFFSLFFFFFPQSSTEEAVSAC